jgi:hypothetical protein
VIRACSNSQAGHTMYRRSSTGGGIALLKGRVEVAHRDRFRPSTLGNPSTPTPADPFSPVTLAIRSRSHEPERRRRA